MINHKEKLDKFLSDLRGLLIPDSETIIDLWLAAPNPAFDNKTPQELIDNDDWEPLENMLIDLKLGNYL